MRSVSMRPSATHESGHSYFAQTGHSHFAATQWDTHWTGDGAYVLRIGQETVLALSAGMVELPRSLPIGMWLWGLMGRIPTFRESRVSGAIQGSLPSSP